MFLLLTACFGGIRSWPVITGQVLEVGTNKPIQGAIVVSLWSGEKSKTFADFQSVCYHVESTTTDKNGRYEIPVWIEDLSHFNITDKRYSVDVFKSGYQEDESTMLSDNQNNSLYFLKPKGTRKEYFKYLRWFRISCRKAGESNKNLYALNKALYSEAKKFAKSKEEQKVVNSLLWSLENIEYGYDEAERRYYKREKK